MQRHGTEGNGAMDDRQWSRRSVLAAGAVAVAAPFALAQAGQAIQATPEASPAGGEWTYTDVLGTEVTLPAPPVRIAANLVTAAALWDLGIRPVAIFDWTASNYPDGDHIAWGNVDVDAVANIGDAEGNVLPEALIAVEPDIVLTLTFDPTDASQTAGIQPDFADRIAQIAPVLVVTDMASTDVQLQRLVELGASLGADLSTPEIVASQEAYEAKVEEFRGVASEQAALQVLFANVDADAFYAAGPGGVAELQFLASLGLTFANADSPEADAFWETLSLEQALKYPADVFYNDVYSTFQTLEELQAQPTIGSIAAIAAGQVGLWERDFPVSYAGVTEFLETILVTLRDAQKVS
jgi:iron complex transport system substrate-binding protein